MPDPSAAVVPALRRAPFGANPVLGPQGERARAEILAAARGLFSDRGYHDVTIEDIAQRSGRAGPSVYQYFESKSQILQVFVHAVGVDLLRHARRLGELGPTARGYDELRVWLGGLAWILRRHALTYSLWSATEGDEPLLGPATSFLDEFVESLAPRLRPVVPEEDVRATAQALLVVPEVAHGLHAAGTWGCSEAELSETLATVFQLSFFPTEQGFLPVVDSSSSLPPPARPQPENTGPRQRPDTGHGLRRPVGPRAMRTVESITEVAAEVLARRTFAGTSIAQVAEAAGRSPASVWTYWRDKDDLLVTLSGQARVVLHGLVDTAGSLPVGAGSAAAVERWMEAYLAAFPRHAAVLQEWHGGDGLDPRVQAEREAVTVTAGEVVRALVGRSPVRHHLPFPAVLPTVAAILHLPYRSVVMPNWAGREELSRVMTRLVARGLLGDPAAGSGANGRDTQS